MEEKNRNREGKELENPTANLETAQQPNNQVQPELSSFSFFRAGPTDRGPARPTSRSAQKRALGPAATSLRALASAAAPLGPPVSRPSPLARVARCLRYASDPPGPHVGAAPPAAAPASLSLPSWPHPPGRRLPHAAHPSLLARARVSDPSLPFLLARVRPSSPPRISPRLRPPRHGRPDPPAYLNSHPATPCTPSPRQCHPRT